MPRIMRKDEKVQWFPLPISQHSTITWRIDEIANSKPSEDCIGLFPLLWGFLQERVCKCSSLMIIKFCWLWHVSEGQCERWMLGVFLVFENLIDKQNQISNNLTINAIRTHMPAKIEHFCLQTEFQASCYKISNFSSKTWWGDRLVFSKTWNTSEARILGEQNGRMVRIWKQRTGTTSNFYRCRAISSMQFSIYKIRWCLLTHPPDSLIVIVGRLGNIIFSQTVQDARFWFCGRILRIFSSQFSNLFFKFSRMH